MKTKIFLIITSFVMFLFSSCSKDSGTIDQVSLDLADDDAISNAVFEDVFNSVDNADIIFNSMMKGEAKSVSAIGDTCPVITITHLSDGIWPKVITLDFGAGCTGLFDNTRSGKIIITVSSARNQAGSKRTVAFENYYHNGIKVEGTKETENLGPNSSQNPVISNKLINGKMTFPDGKIVERSFEHQREWVAGVLTRNIWDDEFLITGVARGKNAKGLTYTNTIITALRRTRACRFVVSGIVKIERDGATAVQINYGDGECDAKATVTRGDETKEILLRYRHN